MGRVQYPWSKRRAGKPVQGMVRRSREDRKGTQGTQGTAQGRQRGRQGTQGTQGTPEVGRRVGRLKVCTGRYAYIRPHDVCAPALHGAARRKPGPPGSRLLAYDYDLLVDALHRHTGRPRHVVIDWIQEKIVPLAARQKPALKIIYK